MPFKVHAWREQARSASMFGTGTRELTVHYCLLDRKNWDCTRLDIIVLDPYLQELETTPLTAFPTALNALHEVSLQVAGMTTCGAYYVLVYAYDNGYRDKLVRRELADIGGAVGVKVCVPPDLDTDSNNDGSIDDDDDPVEEGSPGRIVGLNDDDDNGNGIPDLASPDDDTNAEEDDLAEVILRNVPMTPDDKLTLRAAQGGEKIRVWQNQTKQPGQEIALPHELDFSGGSITVWVEGIGVSDNPGDVVLELVGEVSGEEYVDRIRLTVVKVNLQATDLDGAIAENAEENPGAFVHYNVDNDDDSDNSYGAPKHPGGDYKQYVLEAGVEDNDLMPLRMSPTPALATGEVSLHVTTSAARVWELRMKGIEVVSGPAIKTWDLSDASQRAQFQDLCDGVFVEGVEAGHCNIRLVYWARRWGGTHCDTVKHTFIAVDCGNQPQTDAFLWFPSERETYESVFTHLRRCEWSLVDPTSDVYNCIAWSVGRDDMWINKTGAVVRVPTGRYIVSIDHVWGDGDGACTNAEVDRFYANNPLRSGDGVDIWGPDPWLYFTGTPQTQTFSLFVANPPDPEQAAAQADVMYYSNYHGAESWTSPCACGAGRWIMYRSKCGDGHKLEHVYDQLNGTAYGTPERYYTRN